MDRDGVMLALWGTLNTDTYRQHVESLGASIPYHRAWFFDWFLARYDVRRSRRVIGGGWWAANVHLGLLIVVAMIFALRRCPALGSCSTWWWVGGVSAVYLLAVAVVAEPAREQLSGSLEAVVLAGQSLVPRLAAAGVVGLVLLASSHEFLTLVTEELRWLWLLVPVVGGGLYLMLEIAHRVHPLPGVVRLLQQVADVGATALCHGMALTLVAERGLVKILDPKAAGPLDLRAALSVAVFVFVIGLVVNLVWAEKPVTEPL